jgi:hypothetical protein
MHVPAEFGIICVRSGTVAASGQSRLLRSRFGDTPNGMRADAHRVQSKKLMAFGTPIE